MKPGPVGNLNLRPPPRTVHSKPDEACQPRFSGVGQMMSGMIEWIDSSKAIELVTTDVCGMVLPRTWIEYRERGPDAGRETLIREIAGTIFNVFLIGWFGLGFLKVYNSAHNKSTFLNPKGVHMGAWVNAKSLNAFGGLFEAALKEGKNPQEVRSKFIRKFLDALKSTDQHIMPAMIQTLEGVDAGLAKTISEELAKGPGDGRLTDAGKQALEKLYALAQPNGLGVANIEEQVQRFEQSLRNDPLLKGKYTDDQIQKMVVKKRLQASASSIGSVEEEALINALAKAAHEGKLSNEVTLQAGESRLLGARNLKSTLKEFKYTLEQFIDRVLTNPLTGKIGTETLDAEGQTKILAQLNGKAETGWWAGLKKFLPGIGAKVEEMGLLPYTYKSRWLLMVVPLLMTIGVSVSISFINNWITQRKHGGKVFFPGEGVPVPGSLPPLQGPAFGPNIQVAGLHSNTFDAFQRHRAHVSGRPA